MCRTLFLACFACLSLFGATANVSPADPLTIVLDIKDRHYSAVSLTAMEAEAQRIFDTAGLKFDWRLKSDLPAHAQFANVVIFTLSGSCRMDMTPMLIDERGPLAFTYTSDGEVLPFGEVRCDRVKASLQRSPQSIRAHDWNTTFGMALGRVMAHELYHMLSEQGGHTSEGVTKKSLSAQQLVSGSMRLDPEALQRIHSGLAPAVQK
jgi:hypothetical protein